MDNTSARESIGYVEAMTGHREEAQKILHELQTDPRLKEDSSPLSVAIIYRALGEKEQAFKVLEEASEKNALPMLYLMYDPKLDTLRSDPKFEKLLDSYKEKLMQARKTGNVMPADR